MSYWAAKRQVAIIGSILAIVLTFVIIFAVRLFDVQPTCFDGKQNGEETGVDVGGPCPIANPNETENLVILWQRPFLIVDDLYSVAAYIENSNLDKGIKSIPYRFRLYDEDNALVAERVGETFIGPNRRLAIVESAVQTNGKKPANVFFEFLGQPTWYVTNSDPTIVPITVARQELTFVDTAPRLAVTLQNQTFRSLADIDVIAVLYDRSGNAIHANTTFLPRIESKQTKDVFFTWQLPFEKEVVRVEIIPRVNVFSSR